MKKNIGVSFILFTAFCTILLSSSAAHAYTSSPAVNAAAYSVTIQDYSFNPSSMTVPPPNSQTGETVTISWFNQGYYLHSVTSGTPAGTPDGLIDHDVSPGTYFNLTITQTLYNQIIAKYSNGALPYYCKYHYSLGMTATLTISGTPIPEFSLPTFLLTLTLISIILLSIVKRSSKQNAHSKAES